MAVKFLKPFRFGKGVLALISTRSAGNMKFNVGDDPKNVKRNRIRLAKALKVPVHSLTFADQVHKAKIVIVKDKLRGRGALSSSSAIKATDSLITQLPNTPMIIQVADCIPLLFYDPVRKVVAAAHAGWRGTALKIAQKTVKAMVKLGSRPKDIKVGIGPGIGKCCYEVGPEVSVKFGKKGYVHLDLRSENKMQLFNSGITSRHIYVYKTCTKCHSGRFFSSRAENGRTGRFTTGIMLLS